MEGLEALFERALRLDPPWRISKIELRESEGSIKVFIDFPRRSIFCCPVASWRDLNILVQAAKAKARGYRTFKNLKTIVYMLTGKLDYSKVGLPT